MKIIKKCLMFMLMILAFTSCSLLFPESEPEVSTVNTPRTFTRAQKRVAIVNGTDYIRRKVADQLSNRGWKVSGAVTGKETFAIYFDQLDEITKQLNLEQIIMMVMVVIKVQAQQAQVYLKKTMVM